MASGSNGSRGGPQGAERPSLLSPVEKLLALTASKYWEAVYEKNGSDGQVLKDLILQEHTGMGVVAALVTTIVAALLLIGPSNYRVENKYNNEIQYASIACLSVSLAICIYTIALSFDLYAQTLKVPPSRMLWWVKCFKGKLQWECVWHMYNALYTLLASLCALVYLVHGPKCFWIIFACSIAGIVCQAVSTAFTQKMLLENVLFDKEFGHDTTPQGDARAATDGVGVAAGKAGVQGSGGDSTHEATAQAAGNGRGQECGAGSLRGVRGGRVAPTLDDDGS